jgi:hypothetical protein
LSSSYRASSQARDAQQSHHEILRNNDPNQINEDTALKDTHVLRMTKSKQVDSSSGHTNELSHFHYAAHSSNLIADTFVNTEKSLDIEQWQDLSLTSVKCKFKPPQWQFDELKDRTPSTNCHQLQRWVYETSNANVTFAERIEKSNWQTTKLQRL